jgi:hypothetical protein
VVTPEVAPEDEVSVDYEGDCDDGSEESARRPAISAAPSSSEMLLDAASALELVLEADRRYPGSLSARIEFCLSRGIDYENAAKYLPVIERLKWLLSLTLLVRSPPPLPLSQQQQQQQANIVPLYDPRRKERHPYQYPHHLTSLESKRTGPDGDGGSGGSGRAASGDMQLIRPRLSHLDAARLSPPERGRRRQIWQIEVAGAGIGPRGPDPSRGGWRRNGAAGPDGTIWLYLVKDPRIRMCITGRARDKYRSLIDEGRCPLCFAWPQHHPSQCPAAPDELLGNF